MATVTSQIVQVNASVTLAPAVSTLQQAGALISCGGSTLTANTFLTGGTTATTSCVETFSVAFNSRPICSVTSQTAPATSTPSFTVATNAITITQASLSTAIYDVICVAQAGG